MNWAEPSGDELLRVLGALSHPQRLLIVAALSNGRDYVSRLARESGMSRPLLYMHLKRLEEAGLVSGKLELSPEGKAMKYFELADFDVHLTPTFLADAARSLTEDRREAGAGDMTEGDK